MADSVNDIFDAAFLADIHTGYAKLHARGAVHEIVSSEGSPAWLVTGYDEVKTALGDPRFSLDRRNAASVVRGVFPPAMNATLLNRDPPDHTRLRRLVNQAFTARRVERLRPAIEVTVNELLESVAGADELDFVAAIAAPLPIIVISDLLGVPVADTTRFRELATSSFLQLGPVDPSAAGPEFFTLLTELLQHKRGAPADDLLSALISARDDEDKLDEQELLSTT
jgi:cytochrome P450